MLMIFVSCFLFLIFVSCILFPNIVFNSVSCFLFLCSAMRFVSCVVCFLFPFLVSCVLFLVSSLFVSDSYFVFLCCSFLLIGSCRLFLSVVSYFSFLISVACSLLPSILLHLVSRFLFLCFLN